MLRRLALLTALSFGLLVASAIPAAAHIDVEPEEATAGATETLTFLVAYEGAGTTGVEVQLPEGSSVVEVPAKAGWTSSSDPAARTVRWEGGPVDADVEFAVVVELPDTTGEVLFPAIQLTTEGEVAWISEEEGEGHDNNPAARLTLVADPGAGSTTTSTTEATTSTSRQLPGTTLEAADDGDDGPAAPWLIGSGIAAVVAIAVGGYVLKRRTG